MCIKAGVVSEVEAELMRFTTLQSDVVSPVFCPVLPLHWPQLITTHEKRCQWRCDPCGPIHYPTSCRLPPPGTTRTFKMMVRDSKGRGRVIKSEGEGKRNENTQCPEGGVSLWWRGWLTNAPNLWSVHDVLPHLGFCTSCGGQTNLEN